jgi:hypothetical protein
MPTIVSYTPLRPPASTTVRGRGKVMGHRCVDVSGQKHLQRLPLGSVRGVVYLDALCLHCGTHFVWVEEAEDAAVEAI